MPPHLHPRSRFTSSLFATTLFASFFVVTLPHVLPCPAPRVAYADGEMPDGTQRRRRRRKRFENGEGPSKEGTSGDSVEEVEEVYGQRFEKKRTKRECPVPKPPGLIGEILGFKGSGGGDGSNSKPP